MRAAVIFLLIMCSLAQAEPANWSTGAGVGPNISGLDAVSDDLKSSVGGAIWASRQWGEHHRFDISFDYFKFSSDSQNYPALNFGYGLRFFPHTRLNPFALVGAGLGQANRFPRAQNRHQTCADLFARAGVENLLRGEKWNVGLIMDFEYVFMDGKNVNSAQLALPMLTFNWRFGESSAPSPAPKPAPVRLTEKKLVDSDGDGVFDDKDECPNTPRGSRVNSIGCQPKQKVTKTLKVEFETGKTKIRESFIPDVDEFGQFLRDNPDLNVVIEGHTDSVGSRSSNLKLSDGRAKAVRAALIERFTIEERRIRAVGFGPDKPIADNGTPQGRQLNRRVNAVIQSD